MAVPISYRCRNHPDRAAIGLCVVCRQAVCADCTTKVQGINNCLDCLKKQAKASETVVRRPSRVLVPAGIVAALAFFAAVFAGLGALLLP